VSWSNMDLAFHCLADEARTKAFLSALKQVVTPRSVVLDAGSGTGVFAVAAAELGAGEVLAVEQDELAARILASNIGAHSLNIKVLCGDVREVDLPKCNILVAELVDVWLIEEQLAEVVTVLRQRGVVDDQTCVIPCGYDFYLEFGHCDWQFPYFTMRSPFYEWPYLQTEGWNVPKFEPITEKMRLGTVELRNIRSPVDLRLDFQCSVKDRIVLRHNQINTIRLSGILYVSNEVSLGTTGSINAPIILPIELDFDDLQRDTLNVKATMSEGFGSLSISTGSKELLAWHRDPA
jgi:hypothetical protein